MKKSSPRWLKRLAWLVLLLPLFLALALVCSHFWIKRYFGPVNMDQVVFHFLTPTDGTPFTVMLAGALLIVVLPLCILFAMLFVPRLLRRLSRRLAERKSLQRGFFYQIGAHPAYLLVPAILLVTVVAGYGVYRFDRRYQVVAYVRSQATDDPFIEEHYLDPLDHPPVFPEKKRNLIYIWSESMEASFQDPAHGGLNKENVIEPLTKLSEENYTFSSNEQYGGYFPVHSATYTMGSMVAQSSGAPLFLPFRKANEGGTGPFLPGLANLGDLLHDNGYNNCIVMGSNSNFARTDALYLQHGKYELIDLITLRKRGIVPMDYFVWWGVEDEIVFRQARVEAERLAKEGKPFNLHVVTMDTHAQDGYFNKASSKKFSDQYSNVLAGSARQIADFVSFVQEQDWGKDTLIVIVGDHCTMDVDYHEQFVDKEHPRSVYNCFINPAVQPEEGALKNRVATTLDFLPTILSGLGVQLPEHRMGLGVDLFSGQKTLAEQYGLEAVNQAMDHGSSFYMKKFIFPSHERYTRRKALSDLE